MHIRHPAAAIAFALLLAAGCGRQGADAELAAMMMLSIPGGVRADHPSLEAEEATLYRPEDLHELIDGMAPAYVEAGFLVASTSEWSDPATPGDAYVELTVFDMGSPEGAKKVAGEPGGEDVPLPGGVTGYRMDGAVEFVAWRYYVRIVPRRDVASQEGLVMKLARSVALQIDILREIDEKEDL